MPPSSSLVFLLSFKVTVNVFPDPGDLKADTLLLYYPGKVGPCSLPVLFNSSAWLFWVFLTEAHVMICVLVRSIEM